MPILLSCPSHSRFPFSAHLAIALLGISIFGAIFGGVSCATSAKKSKSSVHAIHRIYPASLRVRRPLGAGADPKAGPGGMDYRSHPLPNEQLDCENIGALLQGLDFGSLRRCLDELSQPKSKIQTVHYQLRRESQPYLVVVEEDDGPSCLYRTLPQIPVPREIYFLSAERNSGPDAGEKNLDCYSSRIDVEANQVLGIQLPTHRYELTLQFPLLDLPKSDADLERLLTSYALTPFWDSEQNAFLSRIVTDGICRKCIGEKEMKKIQLDSPTWPELEPEGEPEKESDQ